MRPVQLLLDENVPPPFLIALRRSAPGTTVYLVGEEDAPPKGTSDPDLLSWCEQHRCLLVGLDRVSLPDQFADHLSAGHRCWGILIVRKYAHFSRCVRNLVKVCTVPAEDWIDRIGYIPFDPPEAEVS